MDPRRPRFRPRPHTAGQWGTGDRRDFLNSLPVAAVHLRINRSTHRHNRLLHCRLLSHLISPVSIQHISRHVSLVMGPRSGRRSLLRPPLHPHTPLPLELTSPQGRAALVAIRKNGVGGSKLGRSFYKGGFEPKMTRREAALILEIPYVGTSLFGTGQSC